MNFSSFITYRMTIPFKNRPPKAIAKGSILDVYGVLTAPLKGVLYNSYSEKFPIIHRTTSAMKTLYSKSQI